MKKAITPMCRALILVAFIFTGLSSAATLPISSGNQWVYSYRTLKGDTGGGEVTSKISQGTLTLAMGPVTSRSDSTFFSITFRDSGFYSFHGHYYVNGSLTKDSTADSSYHENCVREYFGVNDTIYQAGISRPWLEHDIPLAYAPQSDSTYGTGSSYYARQTAPVMVHVVPDSAAGYKRVIAFTFGFGGIGSPNYSFKDTLCWSDKFGLVLYDTAWSSYFHSVEGSTGHSFSSRFVLLSFSKGSTGIASPALGSSVHISIPHHPTARKALMIYPAMKSIPGARFFSLNGRQLANRAGRQLLITVPSMQEAR